MDEVILIGWQTMFVIYWAIIDGYLAKNTESKPTRNLRAHNKDQYAVMWNRFRRPDIRRPKDMDIISQTEAPHIRTSTGNLLTFIGPRCLQKGLNQVFWGKNYCTGENYSFVFDCGLHKLFFVRHFNEQKGTINWTNLEGIMVLWDE